MFAVILEFRLDWENRKVEVWGLVKKRWKSKLEWCSGNVWGFVGCVTDTEEESLISGDNKSRDYLSRNGKRCNGDRRI